MREARWHGSAEERGRNGRWEMRRALRNAAAVPSGKQSNVNKSGVPAGRLDTVAGELPLLVCNATTTAAAAAALE